MNAQVGIFLGNELASYGFPAGHPFSGNRHDAFKGEFYARGLQDRVEICSPVIADESLLLYYHTLEYIEKVKRLSVVGSGFLDSGDTPAFPGCFAAASAVVGTTVAAGRKIMDGTLSSAFVPIAGLHHARRNSAAGFCIFSDIGVLIEVLQRDYNVQRIAYIDIDAHHGDGVFYDYESAPAVWIADIHQDGQTLYPGTGSRDETGIGTAIGTKLNLPLPPLSGEADFDRAWRHVLEHVERSLPEFIIVQVGADSVEGDPLTSMCFTPQCHGRAAKDLLRLANECCEGRLIALGGGGYNLKNLANAWNEVVEGLLSQR